MDLARVPTAREIVEGDAPHREISPLRDAHSRPREPPRVLAQEREMDEQLAPLVAGVSNPLM